MANPLKWTNAELRKFLGERGFIEMKFERTGGYNNSSWTRGNDVIHLVEHDEQEPYISHGGYKIDPMKIGWRNEQIQHDKLKGD